MYVTNGEQLQAVARNRRITLKLSQQAVATLAGVSRKWVSDFERGKDSADLALVFRLLGALGLRVQVTRPGDEAGTGPRPVSSHTIDLDKLIDGAQERA